MTEPDTDLTDWSAAEFIPVDGDDIEDEVDAEADEDDELDEDDDFDPTSHIEPGELLANPCLAAHRLHV